MRSFESACEAYGVKVTGRQRRKFAKKTGLAYRLASHFGPDSVEFSEEAKELYILDMSKPGPNPDKKEKEARTSRMNRKCSRNDRKRTDTLRQKTNKKQRSIRRREAAAKQS